MNSKSHLNRVATVDVNGKPTTVYRKNPSAAPAAMQRVPAPSAALSNQDQENPRATVVSLLKRHKAGHEWNEYDRRLDNMLRRYNPVLVRAMIPAVERMVEIDAQNPDRHALEGFFGAVISEEPQSVEALISYGHLIGGHLRMFEVTALINELHEMDYVSGTDAFLHNAEAHLLAAGEYDSLDDNIVENYWNNAPLMQLVNDHPEHATALIEYWKRGNGISDTAAIEDYLSSGNFKDGWL
jgi:hypothetical protein